ncbi:MAG TPA: hypothetical protein VM100_03215 [Longimicrobiales bacterium]|nr:hypothetical protein [Longimicrobiales bacterium]
MNVKELLRLKRPLTSAEMVVVEDEVLKLTEQLKSNVAEITKDLDPNDPDVVALKQHVAKAEHNVKLTKAVDDEQRAADDASIARQKAEAVYAWEQLPAYEWNNRFARCVGRLLAVLPKRQFIFAHQLAAQATVISNCIAMAHRELEPGRTITKEEVQAYLLIGHQACAGALTHLDELSRLTRLGASDIANGRELMQKVHDQFAWELRETDSSGKEVLN